LVASLTDVKDAEHFGIPFPLWHSVPLNLSRLNSHNIVVFEEYFLGDVVVSQFDAIVALPSCPVT
jgi:hypothetical protein